MSNLDGHLSIHTDGSPDDLVQLLDWFRHDDALRGRIRLPLLRIKGDQMGDLYQVLVVAAGSGGMAAALVRSLTTWLTHRRSDITITVTRADGAKVDLDAKRVKSIEILREVEKLLDDSDAT
ncbi:effector-associated constant component EACC1 [Nocardia colli]|uniref:effector-associated constant component EACC1 n=1 Tax=Nocardia colli TaxID=2545717 RepID=UPI0035D73D4A